MKKARIKSTMDDLVGIEKVCGDNPIWGDIWIFVEVCYPNNIIWIDYII